MINKGRTQNKSTSTKLSYAVFKKQNHNHSSYSLAVWLPSAVAIQMMSICLDVLCAISELVATGQDATMKTADGSTVTGNSKPETIQSSESQMMTQLGTDPF